MLRSHRLSHGKIKRKFLAAINADFLMRKVGGRNQLVMTRGKSGFPPFPPRKFINFLHDFRSIFIFLHDFVNIDFRLPVQLINFR
jgi:hypothetical protein